MKLLSNAMISDDFQCPYIETETARFSYFFAEELSSAELGMFISRGFRKFGQYYFCPSCADCQKCIPLRIKAGEIVPTKSQRRVLKKAEGVHITFEPAVFSDELFEMYTEHSAERFHKDASFDEFYNNFFVASCPTVMSKYYCNGQLAASGFLDITDDGLSSVYFMYRSSFSHLSLGTVSVFKEAEYAHSQDLPYYYLGYYIEECDRMRYKGLFKPRQMYDWIESRWIDVL